MENFELPINYNGNNLSFHVRIINQAYARKFEVSVNGCPILFEADEEGKYRAVNNNNEKETVDQNRDKIGLLKEISEAIESLVD